MNRKQIALAAGFLSASTVCGAAVNEADFEALKNQVETLTRELADMEQELQAEKARIAAAPVAAASATPEAKPAPTSWTDTVAWQGDFRYRYENIDQEGRDERNRSRIRARAGLTAKPQSGLEVGFGLASSEGGDPVSSNQTMGDGGSRKDVFIDLAYFDLDVAAGTSLTGGKFKNFLYRPGKHALLWDSDWNPEGFGLVYQGETFFANAIGSYLDGDSDDGISFIYGGQAGVTLPLGESRLTLGAGYYDIGVEGESVSFGDPDDPDFFGNTFVCADDEDPATCVYATDYTVLEAFAELAFSLFDLPASLFADYVKNTDADQFDTGWAAGFVLGQAKKRGTWELSYAYQDLEADAVLGLVTDSDFGGGGTDTRGHVLRGVYAMGDKWNLAFSYFMNDIGENAGEELDYDRAQFDLNFKY
jgi:outer membrane murein-binding lipoprotein Lpp